MRSKQELLRLGEEYAAYLDRLSERNKARRWSDEVKAKISESQKRRWAERKAAAAELPGGDSRG
jgi:hypothetical protein